MQKTLAAVALAAASLAAHASTASDYTTVARWVDSHGITQFQGECPGSFGPIGVSGPMEIDLRCPSRAEANVILYGGARASINGKHARATYPVTGTITLTTADGATLTFVLPDCSKDAC
ncbi:MAG: hypothetical protein IOC39_24140 [Burkholderia sp.]|jgi:hypothetical protein|uniref:hypothetical protein n=1 Tax=Burkholderia sp. TaxID=36773 RepID=UPI00258B0321|nr:hypothetical protein [Burkholderia sp.]MCA3780148.1 hypothetical protein [Burkholderia sp.]MCA3788485.1 hypothetical protein [Burkholderia sp.]MCA3798447.1 hypothetical protein [Burkholderia sp.]MCA3804023.1 hypothetical protein [Burkholderia sp.]MCA3812264.1 hypothetical protein [Burkholderia sp.]